MRYRRAEHAAWRRLGDETVVIDLNAQEMYGLNAAGGHLWQALDGSSCLDQIQARWCADGVSSRRADLESFCSELVDLGLICAAGPRAVEAQGSADPVEAPAPDLEPPAILWREAIRQAAGTCAFLPALNPLCNQAPFS